MEDADGGHRSFPLGDDAHGIIIYTQSGHMSVQIGSTGRRQYQDGSPHGGTDAERAATAAGYLAYAGRYTVSDEGVVEHLPDVSLFPNWEHTTVPRKATIAHDRLTLELVEPLIIDGKTTGRQAHLGTSRGIRSPHPAAVSRRRLGLYFRPNTEATQGEP